MDTRVASYFDSLRRVLDETSCTSTSGTSVPLSDAIGWIASTAPRVHAGGGKLMFIGNGGSAGIASHMAIDYSKNGNIRSLAFNDGAALTCLGNDLGYDQVFAKQVDLHGKPEDLLIAISSSGRSANILNGVAAARARGCAVVTLSGFSPDNPLRKLGDMNLFTESSEYGFVEIGHLALLHAALDLHLGWMQKSAA
jgi:D-sedoheptulose 7-phosphate isomerase